MDIFIKQISIIDENKRERIILVTENKNANLKELQKIAKENHISKLIIPKKIITTLAIPILATGKIDYISLTKLVDSENRNRGI